MTVDITSLSYPALTSQVRQPSLSRRHLLSIVAASPIAGLLSSGCLPASSKYYDYPFYLRNYVTYKSGDQRRTATSDVFQRYTSDSRNPAYGEATVLNLGNGRRAYQLMLDLRNQWVYPLMVNFVFGGRDYTNPKISYSVNEEEAIQKRAIIQDTEIGQRSEWDFRGLHKVRQKEFRKKDPVAIGFPLVVAFKNERDPLSIFNVETETPTKLFGRSFEYLKWEIERLADGAPLSDKVAKFLPWTEPGNSYWQGRGSTTLREPLSIPERKKLEASGLNMKKYNAALSGKLARTDFKRDL